MEADVSTPTKDYIDDQQNHDTKAECKQPTNPKHYSQPQQAKQNRDQKEEQKHPQHPEYQPG